MKTRHGRSGLISLVRFSGWRAIAAGITMVSALLGLLVPGGVCAAQTAPEGNAHPRSQMVSDAGELPNPFGEPEVSGRAATADKLKLAALVDLTPLRELAVQHNGRVKIMDTLARETIQGVTGRKNYQEVVESDGKATLVGVDPMFTLMDLIIDPAYYADKPLIGINYLPLRRLVIEAAYPGDEKQQEHWLHLTRVTPRMIDMYSGAIAREHGLEPGYNEAFSRLDSDIALVVSSRANLLLVAPASAEEAWHHLATLPEDHPARAAARDLGLGWRAGDAARVNAAAKILAQELPKINASQYPAARRDLEIAYNKAHAFEWGYWLYFVSLLALLLAFGTGRKWLIATGVSLLVLAIGTHAFGFVTRCIIAERFAIQNQFESMTGLSLFAAVVGLTVMLIRKQWLFGAAAAGAGFLVLVTATQSGIPGEHIEREAAILNTSVLLKYHVTTVLVSYGLITLGFIVSLFYLGTHYAGKLVGVGGGAALAGGGEIAAVALGEPGATGGRERMLKDLDQAQMTILQLAFWTLGVGILLGAWWADHSWGRWWAFDPKETWALITWIVYLIVIHVRLITGRNRALATAWLSVAGFAVMIWTYFGVNLVLPGLHAYA